MDQIVSVIVPVYNCKDYLERCIKSILTQSYQHIQLILVDDGSTDGSGEICDYYASQDSRVQVIHQVNSGVSAARNRGMNAATGEFLYFVDSDDAIVKDAIEIAVRSFEEDVDAVFFGVTKISKSHKSIQELPIEAGVHNRETILRGILSDYAGYGAGYPVNKLWRVSAFGNMDNIPRFDTRLYYFEDLEWVVRMLLFVRTIRILPNHLYQYIVRAGSATTKEGADERRECGYHQSIWSVIFNLYTECAIQKWFAAKYYPELVNGVLFAWKNNFKQLQDMLIAKLVQWKNEILANDAVDKRIKRRCQIVLLLHAVHFW